MQSPAIIIFGRMMLPKKTQLWKLLQVAPEISDFLTSHKLVFYHLEKEGQYLPLTIPDLSAKIIKYMSF